MKQEYVRENKESNLSNEHLEDIFNENQKFIYYFAKKYPLYYIERDDYIQLLLSKFWEITKKFDWEKYDGLDIIERNRVFCRYVEVSLLRYLSEIRDEYIKTNQNATFVSLNTQSNDGEGVSRLEVIPDNKKENYNIWALKRLKECNIIKGYLIDYIECGSYSEVARNYNLSRGKIKKEIDIELEELRKVI